MNYSDMVGEIIKNWEKIADFVEKNIPSWRELQASTVLSFSKELADDFSEKFRNSTEALIVQDKLYDTLGSVAVKCEGRYPWYYPYSLIELAVFRIKREDLLAVMQKRNVFIDMEFLINTIVDSKYSMQVDLSKREIEVLMTLAAARRERRTGMLSYQEIAERMNISDSRARTYWKRLTCFIQNTIIIDHGKLGLIPVIVKHERELTSLEKQYTRYSFYSGDHYYSLLFVPKDSTWVAENQQENGHFKLLGYPRSVDYGWNLSDFSGKAENRWGSYPFLWRTSIIKNPATFTVNYRKRGNEVKGFHTKDFAILESLAIDHGRLKSAAQFLNVSDVYYHNRKNFLQENKVFFVTINFLYVGLDTDIFLVAYSDQNTGTEALSQIKDSLTYFPRSETNFSDNCLFALVLVPSRWLKAFLEELANLVNPGGELYEKGVKIVTQFASTKGCIKHALANLSELAVLSKTAGEGDTVAVDWTFQIPKIPPG